MRTKTAMQQAMAKINNIFDVLSDSTLLAIKVSTNTKINRTQFI